MSAGGSSSREAERRSAAPPGKGGRGGERAEAGKRGRGQPPGVGPGLTCVLMADSTGVGEGRAGRGQPAPPMAVHKQNSKVGEATTQEKVRNIQRTF